jgi:hypothetical protein
MRRLLRGLRARGVQLEQLDALELFAYTGELHTADYASRVRTLEAWELDAGHEAALRRNLPGATVRIVDSYEEVARTNKHFGFVVVDNPMSVFGEGHCEHFDLFPELFRILDSPAVLVLNVIPELRGRARRRWPHVFDREHLEARSRFYRTDSPARLTLAELDEHYRELCRANGFAVEWSFFVRRHAVYYLTLGLRATS